MTVEEIIRKMHHWEDPKGLLLVGTDENGNIVVMDYDWTESATGKTFEEALRARWERVKRLYEEDESEH